MPRVLQLGIDIDSPLKAKGTSPDLKLPDAPWVDELALWIAAQDTHDVHPDDGTAQFPETFKVRLPFVGNITERGSFFLHIKEV